MKKKLLFFAGALLIHLGVNAQDVVINKVYNSGTGTPLGANDVVEFLVIKDKLDLRGVYFKDVSSATATSKTFTDGGAKFMFAKTPFWSSLRAGTTIVLRMVPGASFVPDVDASDRTIDIAIENGEYLKRVRSSTASTGTFALGSWDLIVIKAANENGDDDGAADGFDRLIHAFLPIVSADLQTAFNNFTGPDGTKSSSRKFGGTFIIPTNGFIAPTNPTMTVADYNGISSTANPLLVGSTGTPAYGIGETGNNAAFISYLRNAPVIDSITTDAPPAATSVEFTVYFSKEVSGVDLSDFVLTTTESATGTLSTISGSGATYKITVSNLIGEGTVRVDKLPSGTGINAGGVAIMDGFAFTNGAPYVVGKVAPDVVTKQTLAIRVGAQPGDVVGKLNATLVGQGAVDGWAIVSGNDANVFAIDATGNVTVVDNSSIDFSILPVYTINVTASNGNKVSSPVPVNIRLLLPPSTPAIAGAYNGLIATLTPLINGTLNLPSGLLTTDYNLFKVSLFVDGELLSSEIPVSSPGAWSYKVTTPLSSEPHVFYATFNDSGSESDPSQSVTFTTIASGFNVIAHNVITPNADGKNDTWKVENIEIYNDNEVMVFNKMGKVVYQKKQYQQDWDGSSEGKMLETGTYYYRVSLGKGMEPLKGVLTIVRDK